MTGNPQSQEQAFRLHPFDPGPAVAKMRLGGHLALAGDRLQITWRLQGDLAKLVVPAPSGEPPARADGLWTHTCFELFLAAEGDAPYWEVNLAPNGAWNLYRLADYRQGLTPVADRDTMPFTVTREASLLQLTLDLLLPQELARACRQAALRLGVTAVIEQKESTLSYWALAHGGPEADFHRRADFCLRLGMQA
jgi:hypothetical protein